MNFPNLFLKFGEGFFDRIPDDVEIYVEVTMRESVSHASNLLPWNLGMLCRERRVVIDELCRRFADHNHVQDNGLLSFSVGDEFIFL
jgi:hypothetical protein